MTKRFSSPISFTTNFAKVDAENGILHDVVIVEEGEAKGHGVMLNKTFVKSVSVLGNEFGDVGVKCRFGHPNMCSDALGTYVGRYKNFRHIQGEKDKAIADLYLDSSAKITPNGNLHDYILELAKTSPDKFGNSIVFQPGEPFTEKVGEETIIFETIEKLYESDLVDSPAATNSLFSQFDASELAFKVTEFLDKNEKLFEVIEKNPQVIEEFFNKYKQYKQIKMNKKEEIKEELGLIQTMLSGIKKLFSIEEGTVVEETSKLEDIILCPVCNLEFDAEGLEVDENGNVVCPHCGALVNKANPSQPVEQPAPIVDENPMLAENEALKIQLAEKDAEIKSLKETIETQSGEFEEIKNEITSFKEQLSKIESVGKVPQATDFQSAKPDKKEKASFEEIQARRNKK